MAEKKKKIIFAEYFAWQFGGGQVVLFNIIKYLKKYFDVSVLVFNGGKFEKALKKEKIECHYIKPPRKARFRYFWQSVPFALKLKKFLKKEEPSLVYANSFFAAKLSAGVCSRLKVPLIWHKHTIVDKGFKSMTGRQLRGVSQKTAKIICVSKAAGKGLKKAGIDTGKIEVIYNGVELAPHAAAAMRKKARKKYGIKNEFTAGTIGFLRRGKGLEDFLSAAEMAGRTGKNIKFLIAGGPESNDTGYEKELKKFAAEKGLKETVIFTGFMDKNEFFSAIDLAVFTSPKEGFGLVTAEAMAAGVPVLSYGIDATKEIISDARSGFLVAPGSHAKIAEKIVLLSKNRSSLRRAAVTAKKVIRANFTLEKQMQLIKQAVDEVVK